MTTDTLYPEGDTYIRAGASGTNYGSSTQLQIGYQSGDILRGLLRFNLSSYLDHDLDSAVLTLKNVGSGGQFSTGLYYARRQTVADWIASEASWDNYDVDSAWNQPGGDFSTTGQDSVTIAGATSNLVFSSMLTLTEDAIASRDGLLDIGVMHSEIAIGDKVVVYALEDGTQGNRPNLVLTYTPLPLIERIMSRILNRLTQIATANGYTFDAAADRPTTLGRELTIEDKQIVLVQIDRERDEENSIQGNPCRDCWVEQVGVGVFALLPEGTTTPADKLLNIREADLVKAITTPTDAEGDYDWWQFNGMALNARFTPAQRSAFTDAPLVEVQLEVTYLVYETDPCQQG